MTFILFYVPMWSQEVAVKQAINSVIDQWHLAAAEARLEDYFNAMSANAIFIGTDARENWHKDEFLRYAKPHFDKGKAWNFTALERNLYVNDNENIAWFDELLDTQMKLCRGSGVLQKIDGDWKISHYVLSIVIPNQNVSEVVQIKQETDDDIIEELKKQ
ncbi:nuclear transport factor 2 family protein [Arenibacter antarcticus]|uniref:nuclear transport factor 2 family protein n=1 Tax=Arenibacter antarcticus TaxID=2040469 RepID=UPI00351E5190